MNNFLITFLASFLIWLMFAGLFLLWIIRKKIRTKHLVHALTASFFAFLLSQGIKFLFPSLRPFETSGEMPLTLTVPFDSAFPSSHSSTAFALAMSVQKHDKKVGFLFIVFAILVGVGRVLGNVHYYADIFGGAVVGIFSVLFFEKLSKANLLGLKI